MPKTDEDVLDYIARHLKNELTDYFDEPEEKHLVKAFKQGDIQTLLDYSFHVYDAMANADSEDKVIDDFFRFVEYLDFYKGILKET